MTATFTQSAFQQLPPLPANFTGDPLQMTMALTGLGQNLASWTLRIANALNLLMPAGGVVPVSQGGTGSAAFTPANSLIKAGATSTSPLLPSKITENGSETIISYNAASPPAGANAPTLQITDVNGSFNILELDAVANSNQLVGWRSEGTMASPTQTGAGNVILSLVAQAQDNTPARTSGIAQIQLLTINNTSTTDHSSQILFNTTPVASTTIGTVAVFTSQGCSFLGTNTNNNASAGYVGEYNSSIIPIANEVNINAAANITSISVPAGDFDVFGEAWLDNNTGAATVSAAGFRAGLSTTTATLPTVPSDSTARAGIGLAQTTSSITIAVLPLQCRSLSANPITYFLVGACTVSAGTAFGYGKLWYRRRR